MNIPVVDISDFISGNADQKQTFVKQLGDAYEEVGFVAVKGHSISNEQIAKLYDYAAKFFALPDAIKEESNIPGLSGQRGYTSFGKEHAKGFDAPDLKEFFSVGQEVTDGDPIKETYPANVVVDALPDFTPELIHAYKSFEVLGISMLQAIALFLDLEEHYFDAHVHNGNSLLRVIHYPPITEEPKSAIRAEQHEDINLITLLVGASADGLEVMNMQDEWIQVTSLPDQIVVNVGDMLQRLTNNRLRSSTHRVANPPKEKWSTPRYSMPFFLHPRINMSLACLDSCVDEQHPKDYVDYTAGEYLDERLREIGLKM